MILLILLTQINFAQTNDKNKLKNQQKQLQKKIKETNDLIKLTRNTEQLTIAELAILNHQIAYREELVANISYQMRKIDDEIEEFETQKIQLENNVNILKEEYSKMLQYAYKNRNDEFNLFYVFSADSYSEAYKRMIYIDQYADFRIKQIDKIKETQILLDSNLILLVGKKEEKSIVQQNQQQEKSLFLQDKEEQKATLLKLKNNEAQLKAQLAAQQKKKLEIQKKINAAIQAEMDKIKEKQKSSTKGFALTPEAKSLGKSFSTNKGKLPWPVEKGVITGKYGKHPHPTLPGIQIDNKGIDITTDKGVSVRAVFGGKVSTILTIPGAGKVVMISHGSYRVAYSNLQEVYVSKGDKLDTKDLIGKLLPSSDNDKVSEAHIEFWKISSSGSQSTENPELWIKK